MSSIINRCLLTADAPSRCLRRFFITLALVLVSAGGCVPAKVSYSGPRQSPFDVANVRSKDTVIERIDGTPMRGPAVEVLPGHHTVVVRLGVPPRSPFEPGRYMSEQTIPLCFKAEKNAVYEVVAAVTPDGRWWPEIRNANTGQSVLSQRGAPNTNVCFGKWRVTTMPLRKDTTSTAAPDINVPISIPEASLAATAATPSPQAHSTTTSAAGVSPLDDLNPTAPAEAIHVPSSPTAAPRPTSQIPEAEPPAGRVGPPNIASSSRQTPSTGHGLNVGFDLGYGWGGDDVYRAQQLNGKRESLQAGEGKMVGVHLSMTPLWLDQAIGLGFCASVGIKQESLRTGRVYATHSRRFVSLSGQLLAHAVSGLYALTRVGLQREFGVEYATETRSSIGPQLEAGALWINNAHTGLSFVFRHTRISYATERSKTNADSAALLLSLHFYR